MYYPLNYEQINVVNGTTIPSTKKEVENYSFAYWERALFQRACYSIMIDIDDRITGENRDFFLYCLFRYGYICCFNDYEYGFVFQPCTLNGYNVYYQPTNALISNPSFSRSLDLEIGTECGLIKLTPDYMGIWDIITYYARKLSSLDPAIDIAIDNSKIPYIPVAKTKGVANAFKKMFDKINRGESSVFIDERIIRDYSEKDNPFELIDREHMKNAYITDDLLRDQQTLINSFDREIGIPTVPYQKKERMVAGEADSTIIDSQSRITIWVDTLNESFKQVNEMFGTTFSAKPRFTIDELRGGEIDE